MKKYLLSFLALLSIVFTAASQPINTQIKGAISPSPEATSLGLFQDVPVDYAHGLANISLPIYQINHGPLSVNVALRHHGSGLNVRNVESWCGAWNLEGQYMISRTLQSKADDGVGGYYVTGNTLDLNNVNHRTQVAVSERDGEPDIFAYSIPGNSGKFYFDENQVAQFVPKTDLKLEVIHSIPFFEGFILTDKNGTRFYFGYISPTDKGYIELTIPDAEDADFYRSGFYLARVESFDGLYQINFTYQDNYNYNYEQLPSCRIIKYQSNSCYGGGEINNCQTVTPFLIDIEGKKLKTITTPTETVSFEANTNRLDLINGNSLDKIKIETGGFCKEFVLTYDYFEDTNITGPESYRLKLDKVQEQTCTGDTLPAFRFDYYGEVINGKPYFVNRYSRQIDSWGFYNGKTNNELTGTINIPPTTIDFLGFPVTRGASDRSTDFDFMVQGALKTIHNRKGGSIHLAYEANSYPGTMLGSEIPIFQKASCVDFENGCCLEQADKDTVSFATQTLIDDATFELFLSPSCTNPDENFFDILVEVHEKVNDTWFYRTEIGFNQEVTTATTLPKQPLSNLYAFQPGVLYDFQIYTTDAYGRINLYTQPQFTDNIDVGGLRIQKTTHHDGITSDNDITREYFYPKTEGDSLSSGILVKEPIYGFAIRGEELKGTTMDEVDFGIHSEESLIPLSSFQGTHISYSRVEVVRSGHGKTVYLYDAIYSGIDKDYPSAPLYYQRNAGQLKESIVQKENNAVLSQTKTSPQNQNYTYSENFLKAFLVHTIPEGCSGSTIPIPIYLVAATEYDNRSSVYQVKQQEVIQDGVSAITDYEYDPMLRHLAPVSITATNSDGHIFSTENSYVFDDSLIYGTHSFVYDSMVVRNQIATPIQSIEKVNGITTKGSRIKFNSFNPATGGPGIPSNFNAYPYQFLNYEMTWDANGAIVDDGWVLDGTIGTYDPLTGQPNQFGKVGWKTEYYTWHPVNGLNTSRTFEGFNWRNEYYPNSRLLKTKVAIDSQKTHFEYDPFIRLSKIRSRNDQVIVDMDYQFLEGGNALNYINQKTTFAADPTGNSALLEQESRQYFDGLGRLLQTIQVKHSPDSKDVITAFAYDTQGRISRTYEPFESLYNTGQYAADTAGVAYTLTEYETSPLARVVQTTAPSWHPSQQAYGANTAADGLINYQTGGTYGEGALFKNSSIDGNNNRKEIFRDLRGKVVLERVKSADGSQQNDTYRKYDLKERASAIYPPETTPDSLLV